jgi:hypothetical protein
MPKNQKEKDFVKEIQPVGNLKPNQIKKSRSAEDLTTKSPAKKVKELEQERDFEAKKAQNYLAQITKLTAELDTKEQSIKQLTKTNNQLTDQNNELRIEKLKIDDLQKKLTKTQQDLNSAQRIIELRLPTHSKDKQTIDYWF